MPATRMAPGVVSDAAALFTAGLLGLGTVLLGLWIILGLGYSILVDRRRMTICRRHWWEKAFAIGLGTAAACIVVALLPGLLQALNHLTSSRPDVLVVSTAIGLAVVALAAKYVSTLRRYRHLTAVWLTIVTVAIVALELIWLLRDHAIWMLAGSVFLLVVLSFVDANRTCCSTSTEISSAAHLSSSAYRTETARDSSTTTTCPFRRRPHGALARRTISSTRRSIFRAAIRLTCWAGMPTTSSCRRYTAVLRRQHTPTQRYSSRIPLPSLGRWPSRAPRANPRYGLRTNRSAAFLFGLLNARVGVWMDNPRRTTGKRPWTPHWPMYLFFDLFSATTERRRLVNVSDGGHIENLGVYELLKRRCSLIVASDASASPHQTFGDLGNLIVAARVRLGVRIEMSVTSLKPDAQSRLRPAIVSSLAPFTIRSTIKRPKRECSYTSNRHWQPTALSTCTRTALVIPSSRTRPQRISSSVGRRSSKRIASWDTVPATARRPC